MSKFTTGNSKEARQWIRESKLSVDKKNQLINFVKRFPGLTFYKKSRPETDPAWICELGEVFLGIKSDGSSYEFLFSHFEHEEFGEYRSQNYFYRQYCDFEWADFNFEPSLAEFEEVTMNGERLLFIADIPETVESVLAVKAGESGDLRVYDIAFEDIERVNGDFRTGRIDPARVKLAFPSFYEMLNRVIAVRFADGEVVKAKTI